MAIVNVISQSVKRWMSSNLTSIYSDTVVQISLNRNFPPVCVQLLQTRSKTIPQTAHLESAFEQECVILFSNFLRALGVPNSIGAIYGLLYASPAPLCFSDIVEKLGTSKGSASQGLRFLRQSGAVKLVKVDGDRRDFFEPELGLRRLASGLINEKIQPLAIDTKRAVARLKRHAEAMRGKQFEFQMERIKQLGTWHRQLGRILPVVQAILSVPRS